MLRGRPNVGLLARLRRFALDGGPPPETVGLVRDALAETLHDRCRSVVSAARRPLGRGWEGDVRRDGWRRWTVAGDLAGDLGGPLAELGHRHASEVVARLGAHGIDTFVVGRRGDHVELGLDLDDRPRAAAALSTLCDDGPWYLRWRYRALTNVVALRGSRLSPLARRATSWEIHRVYSAGPEYAVGASASTIVTFWARRPDGISEQLGVRGSARFPTASAPTDQLVDDHRYPGRADLPMANIVGAMTAPVDIVFTWVDGSDPRWRQRYDTWADRVEDATGADGRAPARYRDRGELRHALRSVWLYAGWVRQIHVVTAGQVPSWLRDGSDVRLRVVDHDEIFDDAALPTFNSHAIESRLHLVPGLAEHFLYLNDDVFLGRPVRPETFFTPAGLPRVSLSPARIPSTLGGASQTVDLAARAAADLVERDTGRIATHKPSHGPFALRRSDLSGLADRFREEFTRTANHRFRSPDDVSVASVLAPLHGLATGRAVESALAVDYVNIEHARLPLHLARLGHGTRFDAFCLNETERRSIRPERVDRRVVSFLERRFPVAAPWER